VGLSLEAKKFINSEHTGYYVDVMMPYREDAREKGGASSTTVKIHYMDEGAGEPLILIHSVGQSIYTWRRLFAKLSESYRVIAIDLPGHGFSDRPVQFSYGIADYADMLRRVMDALRIQSAHFLAFSMGCAYVLQLARMSPERMGRIIALTPGGVTAEMPSTVRMMESSVFGPIASRLYGIRAVEKMLGECFFDLTNITPDVVNEYYRTVADPDARRAIRRTLQKYDEDGLFTELRAIETPVLILWGSEDKWHPSELQELYHSALKNAGYVIVRNTGHLLHEEKYDKVLELIKEYIPVPID